MGNKQTSNKTKFKVDENENENLANKENVRESHKKESSITSTPTGEENKEESISSESLSAEIKEAVADALNGGKSSTSTSMKEVSMLDSSMTKSCEPLKKSPLTSSDNKHTKRVDKIVYSMEMLRSFKHRVMQGALNDLKSDGKEKFFKTRYVPTHKKQVAFAVDETVCGLVIGKGGVNVKKLEKTFDVEIIVNAKKSETATKRIVTIIGTKAENIEKARQSLDYQQVFIPILGLHQKKLVAQNSEDKFQKWRTESGVVRIEFETELENYDPTTYVQNQNAHYNQMQSSYGYKLSNRELIRQKKEESNEMHSGFLRLVGTKESVVRGQKMIEDELDRVNKLKQAEVVKESEVRVHNVETNYSRQAAQQNSYNSYAARAKGAGYYKQGMSQQVDTQSAIYQLWQQQQQQQSFYPNYNSYNPYRNNNYMHDGNMPMQSQRNVNYGSSRRRSLKYSRTQKSLDDMLLDGKLSVDEYALKMSRRSQR